MPITLTHTGRTPAQTQFGLDTFVEHYKCNVAADLVLIDSSVPQRGDAHPDYAFMFVTDRYVTETGPSSSALDVTYLGCMASSEGNPVLPPNQATDDDAVQSASSARNNQGRILTTPLTVQYYAPTKELDFITYGAEGVRGTVADPTDDIRVISIVVADTSYLPTGLLSDIVNQFFSPLIVDTINTQEIVSGKFWQNKERKTKTLSPYLFSAVAGDYIVMFAPGSGYTVGDSLTMTDGSHTATIVVASIGIGDSIVGYTISGNSFNYTTPAPISATGGSGSGAAFWNVHVV